MDIVYKEERENVVVNALSRKSSHTLNTIMVIPKKLYEEFRKMSI